MKLNTFLLFIVGFLLWGCEKTTTSLDTEELHPEKFKYKVLNETVDSLQYNHPLMLDLNADEVPDFSLTSLLVEENDRPYLYLLINAKSASGNKVLIKPGGDLILNGNWVYPLQKSEEISETSLANKAWSEPLSKCYFLNIMYTESEKFFAGEWLGKKDKYLGLKFKINEQYHFGWLRVSHTAGQEKILVHDFAYNKQAGIRILAGEK